jgi:hypothetical protein
LELVFSVGLDWLVFLLDWIGWFFIWIGLVGFLFGLDWFGFLLDWIGWFFQLGWIDMVFLGNDYLWFQCIDNV